MARDRGYETASSIPETRFDADYVLTMGPMAAVAVGLAIRRKGDA
jgi:hypothetical protein